MRSPLVLMRGTRALSQATCRPLLELAFEKALGSLVRSEAIRAKLSCGTQNRRDSNWLLCMTPQSCSAMRKKEHHKGVHASCLLPQSQRRPESRAETVIVVSPSFIQKGQDLSMVQGRGDWGRGCLLMTQEGRIKRTSTERARSSEVD